jgi:hypothetical protein
MKKIIKSLNYQPSRSSAAEYLTFISATGDNSDYIELHYEDENIWMTQKMMAELYGVSVSAINQHLDSLKKDDEVSDSVIKQYLITASDGKALKYRIVQDGLFESDFDRFIDNLSAGKYENKVVKKIKSNKRHDK